MHRRITHWDQAAEALEVIETTNELPPSTLDEPTEPPIPLQDDGEADTYARHLACGLPAFHVSHAQLFAQGLDGMWPMQAISRLHRWYKHRV